MVAVDSWERAEHGGVLGCELARLWSRWRHGRWSQALGLDGNGCYDELVGMGVGGSVEELTASPTSARARSGTSGSSRINGNELRWPATETAMVTMKQRVRGREKRRGGIGR